MAREIVMSG